MNAELPTDPKAVRKVETAIAKEARADEKDYQHALKELRRTEKSEAKASKAVSKAEKHLKKMEDKEHDTISSLQKVTHKHDQAVTSLHTAQSDVGIQNRNVQRLRSNADTLKARADELFKAKQVREAERSQKLANLRSLPDACRTSDKTG